MVVYSGVLLFYLLSIIFENMFRKRINKKLWILILILPVFVLVALRAPTVGNDTLNYLKSYMLVTQEPFFSQTESRLEIGYVYFMRIIGFLGFDYLGFQIITTAFVYFSLGRFIYKYSVNYSLSMFCFVTLNMFAQTMNISRQFIAIAILTFSISYLIEKKLFKFSLVVITGSLFHITSLIFFILYFITNMKMNRNRLFMLVLCGVILGLGFDYIIGPISNIFSYEGYLDGRYFETEGKIGIYILPLIYLSFLLFGLFVNYGKKESVDKYEDSFLINEALSLKKKKLLLCAIIITFILSIIGLNTPIMTRIISYFLIFYVLYIPDVLDTLRDKYGKLLVTNLIIFCLFIYITTIMLFRPEWTGIVPYTWYFN